MCVIATQASRRVSERARDIILVGIARVDERHHRVHLGRAITGVVVGKDDPMDRDDPRGPLGSIRDAVIDEDGAGFGRRKRERSALRRGHGPLSCRAPCHSEKRTDFCPHPFALETGAAFDIDTAATPRTTSMNTRLPGQMSSVRSSKSGQVCVRTLSPWKPRWPAPHVDATATTGQRVNRRAFAGRLPPARSKKRTGLCPHHVPQHGDFSVIPGGYVRRSGLEIVLSRKGARVAGEVVDRAGASAPDTTVIVFAEDRAMWGVASRFIRAVRPDRSGRFSIGGLPPASTARLRAMSSSTGNGKTPSSCRASSSKRRAWSSAKARLKRSP